MPPNAGESVFDDINATFDAKAFVDPKQFLRAAAQEQQQQLSVTNNDSVLTEEDDNKIYFSYTDIHETTTALLPFISQFKPDIIIAMNAGGQVMSSIISSELKTQTIIHVISVSLKLCPDIHTGSNNAVKWLQWFDNESVEKYYSTRRALIVCDEADDNCVMLKSCVDKVRQTLHPEALATAVLHQKETKPMSTIPSDIDQFWARLVPPNVELCYPWNASVYGHSIQTHEAKARATAQLVTQYEQKAAEDDNKCNQNTDSYWEWPTPKEDSPSPSVTNEPSKEDIIKRILMEEDIRQCLMVERVEQRLIDESKQRQQNQTSVDVNLSCPTEESEAYWIWNQDNITDDGPSLALTVDVIVRNLVADANGRLVSKDDEDTKTLSSNNNNKSNDYWNWTETKLPPSSTTAKEPSKDELLKHFLLEEAIRQSLMVERIEERLVEESKIRCNDDVKTVEYETAADCVVAEGDNYWDW